MPEAITNIQPKTINQPNNEYFVKIKQNNPQLISDKNINQLLQDTKVKEEIKKEKEKNTSSEKKPGLENLNDRLYDANSITQVYFQFEFSKENNKNVILKVVDKKTDEVINQYPSDVSLKIMQMVQQLFGRGQLSDVSI